MDSIDKITEDATERRSIRLFQERIVAEYENVKLFWKEQPFFYDRNKIYWFWKHEKSCYEMVDETDIILALDKGLESQGKILSGKLKNTYIDIIKAVGRENIPVEPPKHWIQFKNKVYDLKNRTQYNVTPQFFFCNPINWDIGLDSATPTIDKLFADWVGEEHVKTLYEIIAYCCYADYPIHTIFCLIGSGRNGKSRFLDLIRRFIGSENGTSTELDILLDSRFESAKLYKKLYCVVGETNFGIIQKTSLLKKLSGQDFIGAEFKGKQPFDFCNYAKILVASNSLPTSLDTSEGFYRRWLILNFDNEFPEGKDILDTVPEVEYMNLANKIINLISNLIEFGSFHDQGTIEERKQKYIMASNPLPSYIDTFFERDAKAAYPYGTFYNDYVQWLLKRKKRKISRKEFKEALSLEGLEANKSSHRGEDGTITSKWYIEGIKKLVRSDKNDKNDVLAHYPPTPCKSVEKNVIFVTNVTNLEKNQETLIDRILSFINKPTPTQEVYDFCIENKLTVQQIDLIISKSKELGIIFEPRPGFLQVLT